MKKIQLDCFVNDESCQIISLDQKIELNNPLENKFILIISNHSQNDCQLFAAGRTIEKVPTANKIKLLLNSDEKVLFRGNLEDIFTTKTNLMIIEANETREYFLEFDLINLLLEEQKITIHFDLLFNFVCSEKASLERTDQIENISTQAAVLAAKTELVAKEPAKENPGQAQVLYLLASCLFVLVFFVIIKIINDKKKKNQ